MKICRKLVNRHMRPAILCRERLCRLLSVLDRTGGTCAIRELVRSHGIRGWEVEQAEELGWVSISMRKPRVGRPSCVVLKLSETSSAKLPPRRYEIRPEISIRHSNFAFALAMPVTARNEYGFDLPTATAAYLRSFPRSRSRAGAAASASRLLRKPMIRAAKAWFQRAGWLVLEEQMPTTPAGIYRRLAEIEAGR